MSRWLDYIYAELNKKVLSLCQCKHKLGFKFSIKLIICYLVSGLDLWLHFVSQEREGRGAHHLAQQRRRVLVEAPLVRHGRLQVEKMRTIFI